MLQAALSVTVLVGDCEDDCYHAVTPRFIDVRASAAAAVIAPAKNVLSRQFYYINALIA